MSGLVYFLCRTLWQHKYKNQNRYEEYSRRSVTAQFQAAVCYGFIQKVSQDRT